MGLHWTPWSGSVYAGAGATIQVTQNGPFERCKKIRFPLFVPARYGLNAMTTKRTFLPDRCEPVQNGLNVYSRSMLSVRENGVKPDGLVEVKGNRRVLTDDVIFSSPSAASSTLLGS